jgi:hypothetical protein
MFERTLVKRMADWPGPLLLAALVVTACGPLDGNGLFDGHGGSGNPPSGGKADGGIGGKTDGGIIPPASDAGAPDALCAATLCLAGTHCEVQPSQCMKAACPPVAVCVKNAPKRVTCGGFAGTACPGGGKCVDDPTDCCDPAAGGADCIGLCQCVQTVMCVKGATFDSSPGVCACVPSMVPPTCGPVCQIFCQYGNVLDADGCQTCKCNPPPVTDDPCATVRCAAGTHCEATVVQCIQAPCPPIASCVADAPAVRCGGFAGIDCPGTGLCADDPTDSCDPKRGDTDCFGLCQCVQRVFCVQGSRFDSSPKVCACVPQVTPPPVCGPVCDIFCPYGHMIDANGCQLCGCNPAPPTCGGPACAIFCPYGQVIAPSGCPVCSCNPPPTVTVCPVEKCTTPRPASASVMCPDGKTIGGPACVLTATGGCGWTVLACPAVDV